MESIAARFKVFYQGATNFTRYGLDEKDLNRKAMEAATALSKGAVSDVEILYDTEVSGNSANKTQQDGKPADASQTDRKPENASQETQKPENRPEEVVKAPVEGYVIFKCLNDNVESETKKNVEAQDSNRKKEQFIQSLLEKVNKTDFTIDEHLFELVQ